jgi:hypothetical protein
MANIIIPDGPDVGRAYADMRRTLHRQRGPLSALFAAAVNVQSDLERLDREGHAKRTARTRNVTLAERIELFGLIDEYHSAFGIGNIYAAPRFRLARYGSRKVAIDAPTLPGHELVEPLAAQVRACAGLNVTEPTRVGVSGRLHRRGRSAR